MIEPDKQNMWGDSESEEDVVIRAMEMPLDVKIAKAIDFLKYWALRRGCLYVANSGGKDSGVIMHLAKLSGIEYRSFYSNTTIDPPELVRFLKSNYPETIWLTQPKPLLVKALEKSFGPPTRESRWCCRMYKENSIECPCKMIGIRSEESKRRKAIWRQVVPDRNDKSKIILCPILYWTEKDVWNFHEQENIPYCELYDDPKLSRLGCVGCPMASDKDRLYSFKKWPKYAANWERMVKTCWRTWVNVPRDRLVWKKPYNGISQRIKPQPGDQEEVRLVDGVEVKGFLTRQRYYRGFDTEEAFWEWWIYHKTTPTEPCQYENLFS